MTSLVFKFNTPLGHKLSAEWLEQKKQHSMFWLDFIKSLDSNIVSAEFTYKKDDDLCFTTTIEFNDEMHKIWFLMRWL